MSSQSRFVFVILHYLVANETVSCVDSIKKFCKDIKYDIVIVDNASPNGTGDMLADKYDDDLTVTVILNKKNEGFARGNNIGINYAVRNLSPKFVVVLNNDITLVSDSFVRLVESEYEDSRFAVLGPKILLPSGLTERYPFSPISRKGLVRQIAINIMKLALLYSHLYGIYTRMRPVAKSEIASKQSEEKLVKHKGVVLHGSCLVFSKDFFAHFNGFDPRTFMYKEEQLLFWRLKKASLVSVYTPDITVYHNEGASTGSSAKSDRKRRIFLHSNQIKSSIVLLKEIGG